jgi:hypothetical protein
MDTATQHRLRELLGPEQDLIRTPVKNEFETGYLIDIPGVHAVAGVDDMHAALRQAHDGANQSQCPAFVWDWRGDGTDYDPAAKPRLVWVVGAFYVGE